MKTYILQFFGFKHLPEGKMQETSQLFHNLAHTLDQILPENPEKTSAMRKLLEAKDCAVRAHIWKD